MESLIVPALILVAVIVVVLLLNRSLSRRATQGKQRMDAVGAPVDATELAREAAAKLSEEQHRRLYSLIAQGQAMAAIKLYLSSTGEGLRASRDAVAALAADPQHFRKPEPAPAELLPAEDEPERFPYRYRAIASKGDVIREVSSNMLNDDIYGRIRTLAKSGDTEAAALALVRHSDISLTQAREFIALLED